MYGVDEDKNTKGYRLFLVHYFDDEDVETMWAEELNRHAYLEYLPHTLTAHPYITIGGS